MKDRINRNKYAILFGIVAFGLTIKFEVTPRNINNFIDVMSNLLSFSSMTTAILVAMLVFVPKLSIGPLKVLRTDKKFLDRILITTELYFLLSVSALVSVSLFDKTTQTLFSTLILGIVFSLFVSSLVETIYISMVLSKTIHL
ncbi:hypothetical protein DWV22_01315 [Weissella confusa]|uniref:hypothetical protein n=1 Tax=Weissella TaxID=46255 RepID=UPI000E5427E6|nr:hypothetical protein [Weissella confusa]RGX49999.1 hypothetical protein DWV22_01315 [Weissella confusa]